MSIWEKRWLLGWLIVTGLLVACSVVGHVIGRGLIHG